MEFAFREKQPDQGQYRTGSGHPGEGFPQDQHGGRHCDHRHQIDVHAGFHRPQCLHREVPGDEAQGRGPQPQKQQIPQVHRGCESRELQPDARDHQRRQHECQPVEKGSPRGQDSGMAQGADLPGQEGVTGPHEGSQQRQQIPPEVQLQGRAVEADKADPRHGHRKACEKCGPQPLLAPHQKMGQQGGEAGRHGDDDPHVGGHGVRQGDVLQQVVQAHAAQPRQGKQSLLPPCDALQAARTDCQQRQKAHHEPDKQDLHWLEIHQQHLGGDEGGPPDHNGQQGRQVAPCRIRLHGCVILSPIPAGTAPGRPPASGR